MWVSQGDPEQFSEFGRTLERLRTSGLWKQIWSGRTLNAIVTMCELWGVGGDDVFGRTLYTTLN